MWSLIWSFIFKYRYVLYIVFGVLFVVLYSIVHDIYVAKAIKPTMKNSICGDGSAVRKYGLIVF